MVTVLLCACALLGLHTPAALASCATDSPGPSPHAFVGTVVATSEGGRIAEVVQDDGVTVTVEGTEAAGWLSDSYSSIDRRYALGGRYEFHPVNDESPFSDNACTATHQLSGPPLTSTATQSGGGVLPAWLPVDEQAGPLGYLIFFGPIAVAAMLMIVAMRSAARKRRTPSTS